MLKWAGKSGVMKGETRRREGRCAGFLLAVGLLSAGSSVLYAGPTDEPLVIAASPGMKGPIEALARSFEKIHPNVKVKVYYDTGLDLRRTVASLQNTGKHFIGTGPIHLIAPGGDELITRLETKYYVLPETRHPYAAVPLVLVVPVALVEAPSSFEELGKGAAYRIAIADPTLTELGRQTRQLLTSLGVADDIRGRLDVASDARGVLDHLLLGQADVGIIFGPDAVKEQERVRVVATAGKPNFEPTIHSMAMERYCPNRSLCEEFLVFIQSPEAQAVLKLLGYLSPTGP
jgi:molybdate transport system substrate-binding protein